jgi:hypothetical protein
VYALFGILRVLGKDWETNNHQRKLGLDDLEVNYNQSLNAVYQDTTKLLINLDNSLKALESFEARKGEEDLASWVIDWRRADPIVRNNYDKHGLLNEIWPVYSGKDTLSWHGWSFLRQDLRRYNELVVQGMIIGTVGDNVLQRIELVSCSFTYHFGGSKLSSADGFVNLVRNGAYQLKGLELPNQLGYCSTAGVGVPKSSAVGDLVVYFHGSELPFILRPATGPNTFRLIGCACFWTLETKRHRHDARFKLTDRITDSTFCFDINDWIMRELTQDENEWRYESPLRHRQSKVLSRKDVRKHLEEIVPPMPGKGNGVSDGNDLAKRTASHMREFILV